MATIRQHCLFSSSFFFLVRNLTGSLKVEPVGRRPLEQSQLDEKDVFILDTGNGDVFVWIGRQATAQEKRESMKKADAYLSEHKRPAWTHVERVAQVGNVALGNCQSQTVFLLCPGCGACAFHAILSYLARLR